MKSILIFISLSIINFSWCQSPYETKATHSLGLHAGTTTGVGFSYRFWPDRIGIQVTGIPIFNGNKESWVSMGLSGLFLIKEHRHLNIFSYLGAHLIQDRGLKNVPTGQIDMYGSPIYGLEDITTNYLNLGLGFGANINILKELSLSIQTGYGLYNISDQIGGNMIFETGLYYHLN